jgi:hypothetical protein
VRGTSLLASLDWVTVATLTLLIVLGLGLRAYQLGAIGFAEDEINKLDAVNAYEKGDITANSEHPMMMKALMFLTMNAAEMLPGSSEKISDETALRLPNVIFGALTVIPLFLLTAAFFDRLTGLLAATLWALGVNAITFNRIGKEDTLLVFFMLFAFYFYLQAKQISPRNAAGRRRNYILSGVAFGLMMASKYFPHYFGLNALYHHNFRVRQPVPGEPSGRTPTLFYAVIAVAFLIANPAVLLPQVWEYLNAYMGERLLVHTGYFFGGQLYKNNMSGTPFWGTPIYFYALFLAIKIPLALLAAFLVGVVVGIRNWRHPGHAFVLLMLFFWIVPYSLVGAKWLRYALSLMPFVYMLAAVGIVALVRSLTVRLKNVPRAGVVVPALALLVFVVGPAWAAYASGPHYALYTNMLGAGRAGYFFPHDEFYDDGLREAIEFVCRTAPANAVIAHETPAVARYYLNRFNRTDLESQAISSVNFDPAKLDRPAYVIVQRGRIYFENRDKLDYAHRNFTKVHEVTVEGLVAAEVFVNQTAGGQPDPTLGGESVSTSGR